jgi:NitT/TauT family transport system ATP-binding protein
MELRTFSNATPHDVSATPGSVPVVAPPASVLRFENVSKTFVDGTKALDNVSLSVRPGEMVAIVGPSGCGKSTLLRLASGLATASSGSIDVDEGQLGYVFQDATLLPWRTVQRNVELLAELAGMSKEERSELATKAIELTGLTGFEQRRPLALSGGMRMRVSLARSLVMRPKVFLFDEPFGALDEITRERLNAELLELFVREKFAGVFVTHSVVEATFLATRVAVMSSRPGRIVAEIPVPIAYPRPPELRFEPEFTKLAAEISTQLREAMS